MVQFVSSKQSRPLNSNWVVLLQRIPVSLSDLLIHGIVLFSRVNRFDSQTYRSTLADEEQRVPRSARELNAIRILEFIVITLLRYTARVRVLRPAAWFQSIRSIPYPFPFSICPRSCTSIGISKVVWQQAIGIIGYSWRKFMGGLCKNLFWNNSISEMRMTTTTTAKLFENSAAPRRVGATFKRRPAIVILSPANMTTSCAYYSLTSEWDSLADWIVSSTHTLVSIKHFISGLDISSFYYTAIDAAGNMGNYWQFI